MVHDRKLSAAAHVAGIGQQLAHQIDQPLAAHHLQTLVAIRRKQHVAGFQRHAGGDRDGFLARGLHIKGELALALVPHHPIIEQPRQQHVPQAQAELIGREVRIPGSDGAM